MEMASAGGAAMLPRGRPVSTACLSQTRHACIVVSGTPPWMPVILCFLVLLVSPHPSLCGQVTVGLVLYDLFQARDYTVKYQTFASLVLIELLADLRRNCGCIRKGGL